MNNDGVSLISAAHPRPPGPWWKRAAQRVWWWLFPPPLSEDSLETIEIEVSDAAKFWNVTFPNGERAIIHGTSREIESLINRRDPRDIDI